MFFTRYTEIPSHHPLRAPTPIPERTPTLILVRDPRDVAVSFYHHLRKRTGAAELDRKGVAPEVLEQPLGVFCRDERIGVPRIVDQMNEWRRGLVPRPTTRVVRYEDLRADPAAGLRGLADFLGFDASEAEIDAAVAFGGFDQMRERERSGFFAHGDVRPRDVGDADSFKVRRGLVGGYRADLARADVAALDELVAERLDPFYGYGGPDPEDGGAPAASDPPA